MNRSYLKFLLYALALAIFSVPTLADEIGMAPQANSQSLGTLQNSELRSSAFPSSSTLPSSPNVPDETLHPLQVGEINYITGGVGDEERNMLQSIQRDYNLHITSASKSGEFVGDTQIIILDHKGTQLLSSAIGPIFYAKLPTGHYTIEAVSGGATKKQNIIVGPKGSSNIHYSW